MRYFKLKTPLVLIFLTRNLLRLICEVYFITSVKILFAVIKYSSSGFTIIQEYSIKNTNMFNYGTRGMILCIILLIILIFLTTIYNATSCDIRQPLNDNITTAKSRNKISQFASMVYFLNSFMYFFIGYDYYQCYMFSLMLLYSIMT